MSEEALFSDVSLEADAANGVKPLDEQGVEDLLNDFVPQGTGERKDDIFPELEERPTQTEQAVGDILEVTVSDPEKKGDGMKAYITYNVNTKTITGPEKFHQSSVIRRYSDFVWLRKQLVAKYTGWLVPPMPEKAMIGNMSPLFVDSRRRGLETFLTRLVTHQALKRSGELKLFLHGEQDFYDAREGKMIVDDGKVAKKSKGFFDIFSNVAHTVTNKITGAVPRPKTKDDIQCDTIEAYTAALDTSAKAVQNQVGGLSKQTSALANAWFEFGFSLTLLGQYETEHAEPDIGNAFAKLGNCADRLSVLIKQQVDTQLIHFEEPFLDFVRMVGAVREMMNGRAELSASYNAALDAVDAAETSLAKSREKGPEDKISKAEAELGETKDKAAALEKELAEVTKNVFHEVQRFRKEKKEHFKSCMIDFVQKQIEHTQKSLAAWESVLKDLEAH